MKKIISLVLALAMILMVGAAFADQTVATGKGGNGSITVANATIGKDYTLYKLFDATLSSNTKENGDPIINYTLPEGKSLEGNTWFTVDGAGNISSTGESINTEAFRTWAEGFGVQIATTEATDNVLVFSGLQYGYYFVKSEVGALLTVDSTTPAARVIDKNQTTTEDKQESVDGGTSWDYQGAFSEHTGEAPTASVGDTVNYKVVGQFTRFIGETEVTSFTFTDTMSNGLTADQNVAIVIGSKTLVKDTDFTVTYVQNANSEWVTTINIPTKDANGAYLYDSTANYTITYSAKINERSIIDGQEENTVTLIYNNNPNNVINTDKTEVKDYNITLTKQDATSKVKLAGAKFRLYDALTGGNEIPLVLVPQTEQEDAGYGSITSPVNNVYRHAKTGENGVELEVGTTGIIEIKGLENGNYYFEETEAPVGYNKLTARTPVTTISNANATITVDNAQGTELPSTGGIGTTIFYILGGLLVVGAAVILVARRKAQD